MAKSIQNERLIQFLMGLNDVYAAGKSNILMLSPLPSVNHAYSLLMQDEKQREVYMSTHYPGNSVSFLATNQNTLGQRSGYYESKGKKTTIICSRCKKPGQYVDKCYKIIDFPSDFKFTKTKRFQESVKSNAAYIEGTQGQSRAHFNGERHGRHFTQDQYSQLIHMLQNVRVNQSEGSLISIKEPGYWIQGPSMKRPLAFGKARAGLYLLESSFQYLKSFVSTSVNLCNQEKSRCLSVSSNFSIPVKNASDVRL
ncbi:hypothetical protein KY285_026922 [Solanum tuberosum]|nr:hypothetical protein KY285_026922 [Solanum tuberosum]